MKQYRADVIQTRRTYVEFDEAWIEEGHTPEQAASEAAYEQGDWEIEDEDITVMELDA